MRALLAVAALVLLVARRHRWLLAATTGFGVLYLVALSAASPARQVLTGFWYTDRYRLGGVFWLLAVLVVLAALDVAARGLRSGSRSRALSAGALVALVVTTEAQPRSGPTPSRPGSVARGASRSRWAPCRPGGLRVPARARAARSAGPQRLAGRLGLDVRAGGRRSAHGDTGSNADPDRVYLVQHFRELGANPHRRPAAPLLDRLPVTDVTPGRSSSYRLTLPPGNAGLTVAFESEDPCLPDRQVRYGPPRAGQAGGT